MPQTTPPAMRPAAITARLAGLLRAEAAYRACLAEAPVAFRDARRLLGLSQEAFGAALGVSKVHVSYLEHGHKGPSMALVRRLGEVLGSLSRGQGDPSASLDAKNNAQGG